jgi:hypothetical protein
MLWFVWDGRALIHVNRALGVERRWPELAIHPDAQAGAFRAVPVRAASATATWMTKASSTG